MLVLEEVWRNTVTLMSNFAQRNMPLIAMAASLQLITTQINRDVFGNEWQITNKGLRWLNEAKETK
jgi:uncharacterized membrane protein YfbV (UPF0208 family)